MPNKENETEPTYQIVTVYEVSESSSRVDGQGNKDVLVRTIDEQVAKDIVASDIKNGKIVRKIGILLQDGNCYLLLSGAPILVETSVEEAVKNIALGKLSVEEKKTLGFS